MPSKILVKDIYIPDYKITLLTLLYLLKAKHVVGSL